MPPNSKIVLKGDKKRLTRDEHIKERGGIVVESSIPKKRGDVLRWNGWGYKDSGFEANELNGAASIKFLGNRYPIGETVLPYFSQWVMDKLNGSLKNFIPAQSEPPTQKYPPSNISEPDLSDLQGLGIDYSLDVVDRIWRAHGQDLEGIVCLRRTALKKLPDVVLWPRSHDEVEAIVELASTNNMVVIPVGGNSSVSGSTNCPPDEKRTVLCLDMTQMNNILWIDEYNLTACCEAGITGQDLERALASRGYTSGHEPDSYELSTLGGWVATRASGMKKNTYGNIEDLVVHVKMVTPRGVLDKKVNAPRISCGPDFNHIVFGSEGNFGVVTEVVLKIRTIPQCKKYDSLMFPTFEAGFNMLREVAEKRCQPSSIRLIDNEQFQMGYAFRTEPSYAESWINYFKKLYVTKWKGFEPTQLVVATLLYEGAHEDVAAQEKKIKEITAKHGGIITGEATGKRGYVMTFVVAYIRDIAFDFNIVAESMETSAPWSQALPLIKNVKHRITGECKKRGIEHFFITARVTQTYDSGCAIYFYFAFGSLDSVMASQTYKEIERSARDEAIACGGTISHHHGVGKSKKRWYAQTVSSTGVELLVATKDALDPNNVFAVGNLYTK